MRRESGFTLIELLMVVAILGILASMAVMNMWRSRAAANEAAAIGSLRNITSAQISFAATCGSGRFSPDLPGLGPQPSSPAPFLSPDMTGSVTVQKSGYIIEMQAAMGSSAGANDCNGNATETGYIAWAKPLLYGTTGNRSFATTSPTSVVWQNYTDTPPAEPFGSPDMPLR